MAKRKTKRVKKPKYPKRYQHLRLLGHGVDSFAAFGGRITKSDASRFDGNGQIVIGDCNKVIRLHFDVRDYESAEDVARMREKLDGLQAVLDLCKEYLDDLGKVRG